MAEREARPEQAAERWVDPVLIIAAESGKILSARLPELSLFREVKLQDQHWADVLLTPEERKPFLTRLSHLLSHPLRESISLEATLPRKGHSVRWHFYPLEGTSDANEPRLLLVGEEVGESSEGPPRKELFSSRGRAPQSSEVARDREICEEELFSDRLIEEILPVLKSRAAEAKTELELLLPKHPAALKGDRVMLQKVILDLAQKALDAMREMPGDQRVLTIQVAVDACIVVSFRDSGPGIGELRREKIVGLSWSAGEVGSEPRLPFSRDVIEKHGGRLWVSENWDAGTTVHFYLPLSEE